jgi:alpha-beta hydrolase superfamily lysophospholipase
VRGSDLPGFSGLPVFLLGVSLGGCMALHSALQQVRLPLG